MANEKKSIRFQAGELLGKLRNPVLDIVVFCDNNPEAKAITADILTMNPSVLALRIIDAVVELQFPTTAASPFKCPITEPCPLGLLTGGNFCGDLNKAALNCAYLQQRLFEANAVHKVCKNHECEYGDDILPVTLVGPDEDGIVSVSFGDNLNTCPKCDQPWDGIQE